MSTACVGVTMYIDQHASGAWAAALAVVSSCHDLVSSKRQGQGHRSTKLTCQSCSARCGA